MRASALLGILVAAQLLAALAIQALVLSVVGAGPDTDAFVAAQTLPTVLLSVISISLQSVWQPRLSVLAADVSAWQKNLSAAQGQVLLSFGGCALVLLISSRWWVAALFPGFTPQQHDLASVLAGILLVANVFSGYSALYVTALRSKERFVLAELITLGVLLLSILAVVAAVPEYGVKAAALIILGRAAVTAVALHACVRAGAPDVSGGLRDAESWRQVRPLLSGSALYKTAPIVDRYWSSQAGTGALTIYNLAQLGMSSIATILERSISIPNIPRLARLVDAKDWISVRRTYRGALARISVVALGIAGLLIVMRGIWPDLIQLILKIPVAGSTQLWVVCVLLLGYLHVSAAGGIVVATFYAMGDTRTPMWVGVLGFLLGVVLKSILFLSFGLMGLALGTSIYYLANLALGTLILERRVAAKLSARSGA